MKRFLSIAIALWLAIPATPQTDTTTVAAPTLPNLVLPDDWELLPQYVGQEVVFEQTLVLTNLYYWERYGTVTVSSHRLMHGTEVAAPGDDYKAVCAANNRDKLIVEAPFSNECLLRTGYQTNHLRGTLVSANKLVPTEPIEWYGNPRPTTFDWWDNCNVRICSTNLEYYIHSDFSSEGFGPCDATQAAHQNTKTVKGLRAIDADIYALMEIQRGNNAIAYLCQSLNDDAGSDIYQYIADNSAQYGSYIKVGFIYRRDRVTPYGTFAFNNTAGYYRKAIQAFTLLENGESFTLSLNHLKAKSGTATGNDTDQGDGQGTFNATRVEEAQSIISQCQNTIDEDVLIVGDMNAHSMEDPLQAFANAGYTNLLKAYNADSAYSYIFAGEAGLLDHALANASMRAQVAGATVFHINSDEPAALEYQNAGSDSVMYRYSDHDAVVVGLHLGEYDHSATTATPHTQPTAYTIDGTLHIANANGGTAYVYNCNGQLVATSHIASNHTRLTHTLPQGIYIVQLQLPHRAPIVRKILL